MAIQATEDLEGPQIGMCRLRGPGELEAADLVLALVLRSANQEVEAVSFSAGCCQAAEMALQVTRFLLMVGLVATVATVLTL